MKGFDQWLTTNPFDESDAWYDNLIEAFSSEFYEANEEWIDSFRGLFSEWAKKLRYRSPREAASIIERAHKLYRI